GSATIEAGDMQRERAWRLVAIDGTCLDSADTPRNDQHFGRPGAAYTDRWEIETAFDELKTHQRGPRTVLRSGSPELLEQKSGVTCAATTRSGPSWSTPLYTAPATLTAANMN